MTWLWWAEPYVRVTEVGNKQLMMANGLKIKCDFFQCLKKVFVIFFSVM